MPKFQGKTAIVAASSSGLGKAIATKLAQGGANVTILSRDEERLKQAAAEIEQAAGKRVLPVRTDVTNAIEIKAAVDQTLDAYGSIDILVTNAGGPPGGKFDDFDDEAWLSAHNLNVLSVIRFIRAVLPEMKRQRSGSIVNIVSTSVKQPITGLILSNTYRSAVVGMAKTLAEEVGEYNIRVNNVAPGRISTERIQYLDKLLASNAGVTQEEMRRQLETTIPLGRYGTPAEFANVVAFLASEEASYLTGVTLQIDGGLVKTLT